MMEESLSTVPTQVARPKNKCPKKHKLYTYICIYVGEFGGVGPSKPWKSKANHGFLGAGGWDLGSGSWELGSGSWELGAAPQPISLLISFSTLNKNKEKGGRSYLDHFLINLLINSCKNVKNKSRKGSSSSPDHFLRFLIQFFIKWRKREGWAT